MILKGGNTRGASVALTRRFNETVGKKYDNTRLRVAARAVAIEEIDMIRQRASKGINANGGAMQPYSDGYTIAKKKIISSGWKRTKGRGKGARKVSIKPTGWAADKVKNYMRLSGRMFSDMYVKNLRVESTARGITEISYTIDFKSARSKMIAGYNQKSRRWLGAIRDDKNSRRLTNIFLKALR